MTINVTFTPTNTDLTNFGYIGLRARPLVFWSNILFFIALPLLGAAFALVLSFKLGRHLEWQIGILLLLPVFSVAFFYSFPAMLVGKSPVFAGPYQYTFGDTDIHVNSSASNSTISWSIVTSCQAHSLGLLLYSGKLPIISIPSRALEEGGINQLLALFVEKGIKIEGKETPNPVLKGTRKKQRAP